MRTAAQQLAEGFHVVLDNNADLGGRDGVDGEGFTEPAPSSSRIHPVLRTLGAGSAAFVLAAGIMAGSMADVPWNDFAEHPAFAAPVEPDPVVVGVVGASSATGPTTVGEVLDIIERAERAAVEAGRVLDPEVQQAAAELGSLLTIYVAQQEASLAPRPGLGDHRGDVVEVAPEESEQPGSGADPVDDAEVLIDTDGLGADELRPPAEAEPEGDPDRADAGSVRPQDQGELGTPEITYEDPTGDGPTGDDAADDDAADDADGDEPRSTADLEPVVPVEVPSLELPTLDELLADGGAMPVARPYERDEPVTETTPEPDGAAAPAADGPAVDDAADGGAPAAADHEGEEHADEEVTFDDVVVAATRLATLLDPASATYVVDVRPAVTELEDGTFVLNDGTPVTADGLPLDAATASLSAALRSVVDQHAGSTAGFANGRIPASVLCDVPWAPGHMLRCDAAVQFEKLNEAYRDRFGTNIPITDSYRSYAAQVAVRAAKPHLAAVPGTSNHGWGLAVDLSHPISGGTSAEYAWLRVHGPDYGWDNPTWARPDGRKPEPWHFEFFAAGPVPDRATSTADIETAGGSSGGGASGGGQDKATPADSKDDGAKADGAKDKKKSDGAKDKKKSDGKKKADGAKDDGGAKKPASDDTKKDGGSKEPGSGGTKDDGKDDPTPKPSPSDPTPEPSPSDPTPEPSPSDPTPEPSPSDPTPEPSPSDPTPEPSPSDPTPEPSPSDPTPKPSPSDPTPKPESSPSQSPEKEKSGEGGLVSGLLRLDEGKQEDVDGDGADDLDDESAKR